MAFQTLYLYGILGISETATVKEIKDAYRLQAMKWHPDRNLNNRAKAEERFKEIGYAYKVLSDPLQRAEYDAYLASQRAAGAGEARQEEAAFDTGMSDADAAKIFFEQMLDLAFELARRGFGEEKILKMLLALDCPESIAKAVAEMVVRSAGANGSSKSYSSPPPRNDSAESRRTSVDSVEADGWAEVAPYYAAVIGGIHADDRMDDVEYEQINAKLRHGVIGYVTAIVFIFLGIGVGISGADRGEEFFYVLGGLTFVATIMWRIIKGGSGAFNRERAMRYYMPVFESYHTARPLPYRWNWSACLCSYVWMAHRRMPIATLVVFIILVIVGVLATADLSTSQADSVSRFINLIFAITMGFIGNRFYFRSAQRRINKALALSKKQALPWLRSKGGTNGWSALLVFFVSIMLVIVGNAQETAEFNETHPQFNGALTKEQARQEIEQKRQSHSILIKLDKFTVNLKPENGEFGFMQAEISLQVEGMEANDYLKSLMPRIRNDITLIMSNKQASDLASKEGKVKLAAEIRDAINLVAGPPWRNKYRPPEGPVIEVLFESIIIQ